MKHAVSGHGIAQVTSGYLIWGSLPIFWKTLSHVSSFEVLLHRILWAAVWASVYFLLKGNNPLYILKQAWSQSSLPLLILSALVVAVNWLAYIYAVTSGHILQASLGYYICPIVIVVLSVLLFKEKMNRLQKLALVFCIVGVGYSAIQVGTIPWLSLLIAGTFALYATSKKLLKLDGMTALLSDAVLLSPIVLIIVVVTAVRGQSAFLFTGIGTDVLLVLSGIATLAPLVLFIQGTMKIPYKTVGFLQFITPTMTFVLGVAVYGERFTLYEGITFLLILLGVGSYVVSLFNPDRSKKAKPSFEK
ncbi:MAG: EamA family transporter RarD [Spirochaetota bacterium]